MTTDRISYSEEEDFSGQFELWQANCYRSLKGKRGQATLRELLEALEALPAKRLVHQSVARDGDVCALGALLAKRGVPVGELENHDSYTTDLTDQQNIPHLVAWKIVEMNDITFTGTWNAFTHMNDPMSPEERYERMVAWVKELLV